ncbi:MAG: acyl-CoA dehydrogenase family protein [Bacteroidetes bacterium]|nr:acyl-CoA dehydrogenase family protein [Bacteroidota bacterium]
MSTAIATSARLKGGEFLLKSTDAMSIFIPEEWNEEQKMISQMCDDFLEKEVYPHLAELDAMTNPDLMPSIIRKAADLGLLGAGLPEQYGGMGLDFLSQMLLTERFGAGHSFAVGFSAHTGIGTLPTLYYGTDAQKNTYLPKLGSGEWLASYCLTEPGSGSDALGAKTTATLSEDGKHYIINGQKIWITNGGFANLFTVFAKLDGKFTGFLVPGDTPGISRSPEAHKMGIKGSSTREIFFQDVKIPVENLLGEIGKGHKIAFNILNIGRIKLAAAAIGGGKKAIDVAVKYANDRQQFGVAISTFGAIQYKLAEMAIRMWVMESAVYRASFDIQNKEHELQAAGASYADALLGGAEEYAIECALLKVLGSEVVDYIVDEGVQIFGGNGFSADFPMDRAYRDARINRIFEGTNEINRLLGIDMIMKRALKGELDLQTPIMKIMGELTSIPEFSGEMENTPLSESKKAIGNLKKALLMVSGAAVQTFMAKLEKEQEIIMNIADMGIYVYAAESALLRAEKLIAIRGEAACADQIAMVNAYVYDAADHINKAGKDAINSFAEGDMQRMMLMGLKRFTKVAPFNAKNARRQIAASLIAANGYCY